MIRKLDKWWFRLLGKVHGWVVVRGVAHCERERRRRRERHLAWQNKQRN